MKKIILFLTIISLLLITFSCGGGGGSSQGVSSVTVSASFKSTTAALRAAASTLTNIRYTVSGPGMNVMTGTVPITDNLVEFILDVPNGPQRRFLIEALDIDNKVKYTGEAYRDLDGTPITIEIVLVSTTPNPMFGKWGHVGLEHHNDGKWESCATTLIFNADGTGTETYKKNDGGILASETENFTYSITPNQDGSFTLTMVYPDETETPKIVFSDDGNMVIVDRTTDTTEQRLDVAIRMDTSKTYTIADWIGENYIIAYEYDTLSQPSYDALSGIAFADGNGNLSGTNTVNSNGTLKTETYTQTYSISPDGSSADGSAFFSGYTKLFISSSATDPTEWRLLFGMKKGDKTYSSADLAGTWAWVGFGDDYGTSFNADFGTMTCDSSGNCVRSSKNQMDGNIRYESSTIKVSVSPDGSFGASLTAGAPSYAGAIGNNGNSFVVNASFDQSNLKSREIIIGVRCSTCSNLTGLSGTWLLYLTPDGGVESSDCFYINQYDNFIYFSWWQNIFTTSINGTITGNNLELSGDSIYYDDPINFSSSALIDGNTITGTYSYTGAYVESGDWRAERGVCKKAKGWVRVCNIQGDYVLELDVWDLIPEGIIFTSANVTGPNIGTLSLNSGSVDAYFGKTKPTPGDVYTFSVNYSDGASETVTATVRDTFVDAPVPISPADGEIINILTPTFSWQPSPCNCQGYYRVWVVDSLGNDVWSVYPSKEATSVVYNFDGNGIPLKIGETYEWRLIAFDKPILGGPDNNVWAISSFTVQ